MISIKLTVILWQVNFAFFLEILSEEKGRIVNIENIHQNIEVNTQQSCFYTNHIQVFLSPSGTVTPSFWDEILEEKSKCYKNSK